MEFRIHRKSTTINKERRHRIYDKAARAAINEDVYHTISLATPHDTRLTEQGPQAHDFSRGRDVKLFYKDC
jgi:hypothetical protein